MNIKIMVTAPLALFSAFALSATTVTMEGSSDSGNSADSIYNHASHGTAKWSDLQAPHEGADYVIPAGFSLGIQGGNAEPAQCVVDFGGDSIILYGTIHWYGFWGSTYRCTKPITMKPGSVWNIYNGQETQNYANYIIEGTDASPALFRSANGGAAGRFNHYYGTMSGAETAVMQFECSSSADYTMPVELDAACVLTNYQGTVRFNGVRSQLKTTRLNGPCAVEAKNGALLQLTGNAVTSTVRRLTIDGASRLTLSTAANQHVIAVSDRLVLADGAVLTINKINAMPAAKSDDDMVRRYPLFLLSKAAYENPATSIGAVTVGCGVSIGELPHGFLYTNVLENGSAEIGWTHRPVVTQKKNGGWANSVFKDDSANIAQLLSDGRPMHSGDYLVGSDGSSGYNEYPQTAANPYICPATYLVFNGGEYAWYTPNIYFSNCVLRAGGTFRSYNSGHFGYTVKGKVRVEPTDAGLGWLFKNRFSHTDTLECDLSGSGLLDFTYDTGFAADSDLLSRWYCTYRLSGDNSDFTGTMKFRMCPDGVYSQFTAKGLDAFVQSPSSNIIVWVRQPSAFGGALPAFNPSAVDFGNWTRLMTTNSVAFTEQTRGWAFRTNISISVDTRATLTLANRIVCSGGGDIMVNAGSGDRMGYVGDPNMLLTRGGGLVLGGAITVADGEPASTLKMMKGPLKFASRNALTGVNLQFSGGTSLKVDPYPSDPGFKSSGAVLTADVSFPAEAKVPLVLTSEIEASTTVGVLTVSDSLKDTVLAKLEKPTIPRYATKLTAESNGDGTSTIRLRIARRGLVLFVQ